MMNQAENEKSLMKKMLSSILCMHSLNEHEIRPSWVKLKQFLLKHMDFYPSVLNYHDQMTNSLLVTITVLESLSITLALQGMH